MLAVWLVGVAGASVDEDVAKGWYLWRTGQSDAAAALASEIIAREPGSLAAHALNTAMQVVAGNGASVEAGYREWWGELPDDPVRRVALAWALTLRRTEKGAWCDEVVTLVSKVPEGEAHYWATLADQQRELRCTGQSDHAEAELRRLAKEPDGLGFAEGVLAKLDAGYIKPELPDELEQVWTDAPYRVDRAGVLWKDSVSGPAKAAAKRVASRALDAAVASSDPVRVHAALVAYQVAEDKKQVAMAQARLKQLDPAADPLLVRSVDDVADPEIYTAIDACTRGLDAAMGLSCIDALGLPESGAIAAWAHYQRRRLNEGLSRSDAAYASARAAWQADPTHRFHARSFVRKALERNEDLALALEAADGVLFGRLPDDVATIEPALRPGLARDLDHRGQLLRLTGRPEEALADLSLAETLAHTPLRQLLVGIALAEAGRGDEAAPKLAYALTVAHADTARVTEARDALQALAKGWQAGGLQAMIDAAARTPKDEQPTHPLVGQKLVDAALLPAPVPPDPAAPKGAKAPPPGVRVIAVWASWVPESVASLDRLSTLSTQYREQGVTFVALDVDPTAVPPPEGLALETRYGGPAVLRQLRSVTLPTVIVVDGKGTVVAGLSPYDRGGLGLEKVLDGMVAEKL